MKKKNLTFYQAQRLYNLPRLGDYDHDGVLNIFDCRPYDPNRDGILGRALNVVSGGKYGQSKEAYEAEKLVKAQAKLEKIKEKERMPKEPVYGQEYEYSPKVKKEEYPKRQEPHILYVQLNPNEGYSNVGQFPSHQDALQHMHSNYSGHPYKILSVGEAIIEGEKQEIKRRRLEMLRQVKRGAVAGVKAVGSGIVKASEKVSELEEKRQKYLDRVAQERLAREERDWKRTQMAEQRELLRAKKELLQEELRAEAREREELRRLTREREQRFYAPPTFGVSLQPPSKPSFDIQLPSSPIAKQPWGLSKKATPKPYKIPQYKSPITLNIDGMPSFLKRYPSTKVPIKKRKVSKKRKITKKKKIKKEMKK